MKESFLNQIKFEAQSNKLFAIALLNAIELYGEKSESEKIEQRCYALLDVLSTYNEYIDFVPLVYDLQKIIAKRLNEVYSLINLYKAIDILNQREV